MPRRPATSPRATARRAIALSFSAIAAAGVGCNNNKDDALTSEANELRSQVGQLQAALDAAQQREIELEGENQRLTEENARLSSAKPTGFGIDGADVTTRGSDIVISVAGDVLFASGSVSLRQNAQNTLNQVASVINSRYPSNEIQVAGHTDTDPIKKSSWKTNERLSAERALAVEEYLAGRGISRDRMHIAGFGPAKQRGSKEQSRRVEIIILGNS